MTDQAWQELQLLNNHPSSKRAAQILQAAGQHPSSQMPHLLQLVEVWLQHVPDNNLPWSEYRTEMQDLVTQALADDPVLAVQLVAPDGYSLQEKIQNQPEREMELIQAELQLLLNPLNRAKNLRAAGRELAENVYSNLRFAYPTFGPASL